MAELDDLLAQYGETRGRSDFPSFLPLPPLRKPAEVRNLAPRPGDAMAPVAETVSPAMGAYGLGQLLGDTYSKGSEGDWSGVAANSPLIAAMALPIPGAKRVPRVANPIKAYHGSPRDFDKFSDQWLTFASENPAHADMYRSGASDRGGTMPSGWDYAHSVQREAAQTGEAPSRILEDRKLAHLRHARTADDLEWITSQYGGARKILASDGGKGNVYEINLHAPREHILDWDVPFSKQSPYVREALSAAKLEPRLASPDFESWTGKHQAQLRDAGIPAVAYREGDQNYMITNPAIIEILRKYGIAAPVGGGILADLLSQPSPTAQQP